MSKMARTIAMVAGGTLLAAALQAAPLPGFSLTAQTEHFSFYTRDNQRVDARKSEEYLARVESLLGHRIEGRADYYRYETPEQLAASTGTYAAGVTFPHVQQIHSTHDFHAHEIVHLVAARLGNPGSFFQEGLAVALGNDGKWNGQSVDKVARQSAKKVKLSRLVAAFDRIDPQTSYALAGSFVASLIKAHGLPKVAEFFRASAQQSPEAAFVATFGETLDQAGDTWAERI